MSPGAGGSAGAWDGAGTAIQSFLGVFFGKKIGDESSGPRLSYSERRLQKLALCSLPVDLVVPGQRSEILDPGPPPI